MFGLQSAKGQNKVHFYYDNFRKAKGIAKIEKKDVFIDTWASWCVPCKRQAKVFDDPRVIKYLNKNFINLKINMEKSPGTNRVSEIASKMKLEYEVVFLPTLLIVDHKGVVKAKTDSYMNAEQFISFLKFNKEKKSVPKQEKALVQTSTPSTKLTPKKTTKKVIESRLNTDEGPFNMDGPDEAVYIPYEAQLEMQEQIEIPASNQEKIDSLNNTDSKPIVTKESEVIKPLEIIKEETIDTKPTNSEENRTIKKAELVEKSTINYPSKEKINTVDTINNSNYLFVEGNKDQKDFASYYYNQTALELQNNQSYRKSFMNYLSTQTDWSTEKNMRFIYNYISSTQSPAFQFLIQKRPDFEELVGRESYEKSIQILIYNRLYQGYPRATYEDAMRLYGYIYNDELAEKYSIQYYLQRLLVDKSYDEFIKTSKKFLKKRKSSGLMLNLADVFLEQLDDPKKALKWTKKAIDIEPDNHLLYECRSKAYLALGKKEKAMSSLKRAKKLATEQNKTFSSWETLVHQINGAK